MCVCVCVLCVCVVGSVWFEWGGAGGLWWGGDRERVKKENCVCGCHRSVSIQKKKE